jgi:hypothetical protein
MSSGQCPGRQRCGFAAVPDPTSGSDRVLVRHPQGEPFQVCDEEEQPVRCRGFAHRQVADERGTPDRGRGGATATRAPCSPPRTRCPKRLSSTPRDPLSPADVVATPVASSGRGPGNLTGLSTNSSSAVAGGSSVAESGDASSQPSRCGRAAEAGGAAVAGPADEVCPLPAAGAGQRFRVVAAAFGRQCLVFLGEHGAAEDRHSRLAHGCSLEISHRSRRQWRPLSVTAEADRRPCGAYGFTGVAASCPTTVRQGRAAHEATTPPVTYGSTAAKSRAFCRASVPVKISSAVKGPSPAAPPSRSSPRSTAAQAAARCADRCASLACR